jgi:hypothetical protein
MRSVTTAIMAAIAVLGAATIAAPAGAQPAGSYLQTCRDIKVRGKHRPNALLIAECRTRGGHWIESSLHYKRCKGDIYNDNGYLWCERGGPGNAGGLPPGNWRQTCREAYIEDRILYAECQRISGRWEDASLDLRGCPNGPIGNRNGRLVCAGGIGHGRLTLYQNFDFGGRALQLRSAAPDLRDFDFNDRASSIRVEGNWYVCTNVNYSGECSKVAGAFNLNSKWNKRISSARPQ